MQQIINNYLDNIMARETFYCEIKPYVTSQWFTHFLPNKRWWVTTMI